MHTLPPLYQHRDFPPVKVVSSVVNLVDNTVLTGPEFRCDEHIVPPGSGNAESLPGI